VTFAAAILLGVIQGLTEFLPVSSSAHLILARAFFGWETPPEFGLAFDVAVHVGTLAAIVLFFRTEIAAMIGAIPTMLSPSSGSSGLLLRLIAIGTIPAVAVGVLFDEYIEAHLRTPAVAAVTLTAGAILMLAAERLRAPQRTEASLTIADAALIGTAQASALVPGVSRSGSTIAVGMLLGMRRDAAARFAFLLGMPAIAGAGAREALALGRMETTADTLLLFAIGMTVSAVVGYVTIKYFLRFLAGNRLDLFAYYRLALATVTVIWLWQS
jgi:undecaprenyl-diphosphatase